MKNDDKKPLYRIVTDEILRRMEAGELVPGEKLPSEKELCADFGVSHITVVRVFRELQAAGVITARNGSGYFVAPPKRGFTGVIGNFVRPFRAHSPLDNYFNDINLAMREEAARTGFSLLDSHTVQALNHPPIGRDVPENILRSMLEIEPIVDGFLADERIPDQTLLRLLERTGKPVVVINRKSELDIVSVMPDNAKGMRDLLEIAWKYRFERFVFCGSNLALDNESERAAAFREFLRERRIPATHIRFIGDIYYHPASVTAAAVREALRDYSGFPLLFVCGNDSTARTVSHLLEQAGVGFGGKVAVIGFDGFEMGKTPPRLTTVDVHPELMGRGAVAAFREELQSSSGRKKKTIRTAVSIILGDTL